MSPPSPATAGNPLDEGHSAVKSLGRVGRAFTNASWPNWLSLQRRSGRAPRGTRPGALARNARTGERRHRFGGRPGNCQPKRPARSDDGSSSGAWRWRKRRRQSVRNVTRARRREHALETHWRSDRRHRRPLRARAHQRRRGRLGVVLVDRLLERLLDGAGCESGSLLGCLFSLDPASLGERNPGASVCLTAAAAASGSLQSELHDLSTSPGPWAGSYGLQPSPLVWRFLVLAVAVILGLLIALGETGRWDLILRFIYQAPYGRNDPLFDKDIGFYLFSLPVYVAVKNWLLWLLVFAAPHGRRNLLPARRHQSGSLRPGAFHPRQSLMAPRCSASFSRSKPGLTPWTATSCSTTTTASSSAPATPMFMSSCRRSGC